MELLNTITDFFITNAYAADAPAAVPQPGGNMSFMLMLGVLFLFMYFAMWRPQSKRAKEQRDLMNGLSKGDEVVTAGGILGKITKVNESYVTLELTDNVEITIQKSSIVGALPKGTLKSI